MGDVNLDYPRGLTFEQVWAAIQASNEKMDRLFRETDRKMQETDAIVRETARQMKETDRQMRETDRQMQETTQEIKTMQKETAKQIQETDAIVRETARQMRETDRQMKEYNKRFSDLSNRFGEIVECMVIPNLVEKFVELGFTFTKAYPLTVEDKEHDLCFDADALLENGDKVMAVEIKSKPNQEDIDYHLERMEKLRKYADLHQDRRIYLGAMAGVVFSGSLKTYSLKHGLYVIEPSGETFRITIPEGMYYPHEW